MGTITVHFVGLFLFDTRSSEELRIAVIDADRSHESLKRHTAYFYVEPPEHASSSDWPVSDHHYELKGAIALDTDGELRVNPERWVLPRIADGCSSLQIDDSFFLKPTRDATHAVISLRSGELCGWRFDQPNGAINTSVTFADRQQFAITREGQRIEVDTTKDSIIVFMNTELGETTTDDTDWYWYYVATGHEECAALPRADKAVYPCPPLPIDPLSLGCSNSQWP